jgi:16S rRNA (adenine1518-N6/adenine1519-N6)-dimethyltransferase
MLLNWTKNLLGEYGIKPDKRMGQNFLIDENALEKLINAADVNRGDTVLEVGAGIGTITLALAKRAKRVIAIEKDKALLPILKETTAPLKNVEVLHGDILKLPHTLYPIPYTLVGNIPYYLTAPLIRKFLESPNPPKSLILMVQKEMAQRICASPPDMSILAVSVQVYAKPEIISYVPRSAFWPQPKVDSAIIRIISNSPYPPLTVRGGTEGGVTFFRVVKAGFSSPRKQLINNLSKGLKLSRPDTERWLRSAGIAPERRAETLTVEDWRGLAKLSP